MRYGLWTSDWPQNVGWICEQLIKCQIDVYPYAVTDHRELRYKYDLAARLLSKSNVPSWAQWWKKHSDMSLLEMQITVAESSLSILRDKDDKTRFNSWGQSQAKGIEKMIQELQKGKKPKAGALDCDVHLMQKSSVTKVGGEERYYFYNGK